ncbi:hypothetical protein MJO52_04605 [Microbulbifer variabilis]|uniref:Glucuronyl hydrolase n=1 Tax=Microbulbifer variabilis TaxID=266805 RepID=A0ABY4VEJ8_9GAMM|nr:hypothetical protein [Microbulbifer variabilis]USD22415.1 hypothetical protein MJO52_04605 [Microbulbifer variabilis]
MNNSLLVEIKESSFSDTSTSVNYTAIYAITNTLERISYSCDDNFPIFTSPQDNQWKFSSGGSWMGGFWCGSWWLKAKVSRKDIDRNYASSILERLTPKLYSDTIFRSMIYWYALAPGIRLFNDTKSILFAEKAAKTIFQSFNSKWDCYPMGTALGAGEKGKNTLNIDGLAALIQLLQYGDSETRSTAKSHTDSIIKFMLDPSGNFSANATLGSNKIKISNSSKGWARGHSWGLLGLATASRLWGGDYHTLAESLCVEWLNEYSDKFPKNLKNGNRNHLDPSASLIAALSMYKLSTCPNNMIDWRAEANSIIKNIIESDYFNINDQSHEAYFNGCFFRINSSEESLGETIWGYFFLLQALLISEKIIDPNDI